MDRGQGSIKSKNFPARQVLHIWKAKCNFSTLISSKLLIVCMTVVVLSLACIFTQRAYVVLVLEEKGFFFRVKIDLSRRHGQMKEEWLTSHGKYSKSALPALYFTPMQRLWTILCALTQTWNFLIFPPGQTAHDLLRCVFNIGPTPAENKLVVGLWDIYPQMFCGDNVSDMQ